MAYPTSRGAAARAADKDAFTAETAEPSTRSQSASHRSSSMDVMCCRRRRQMQASAQGASVALKRAAQAAAAAVGAAGSGWALLAAARALLRAPRTAAGLEAVAEAESGKRAPLLGSVPQHIAVIMDGNRRYGRREHGDSLSGHRAGGDKLRDFIEWCVELDVKFLTVFAFSTENWKRGKTEVDGLMGLFLQEVPRLGSHTERLNVRVKFLTSEADLLSDELKQAIADLEECSAANTAMQLNVCLSYGGRSDVARACRQLAQEVRDGELHAEDINEGAIAKRLLTGMGPDPDVLIRTSGEQRMSNFLVFQLAYTEMFFLDKHWPEVTREDLIGVVNKFGDRSRRYGK